MRRPAIYCTAILLFAAFLPCTSGDSAVAQTATNLDCKGCVGKKDLGKKAVRTKHIRKKAITTGKIRKGAVNSNKIENGGVRPVDLATGAKPTGADSEEGNQSLTLSGTAIAVRTVTISAPSGGVLIANASGYFSMQSSSVARCAISPGVSVDFSHTIQATNNSAEVLNVPFSALRLFDVTAGDTTIYLACRETAGDVFVVDSVLAAVFVPNRY